MLNSSIYPALASRRSVRGNVRYELDHGSGLQIGGPYEARPAALAATALPVPRENPTLWTEDFALVQHVTAGQVAAF